ncbi:MAG: PASTA domain-containing protein [Salinivirgaceae bacterium]|nr:PASTA domain-containing protein [Salinivirgaceae bacterium]MDD4746073.1 PASTA domain-containing protein [Salinivirgaceae bacterium]MDY0280274.1 PASTA domain-containing protein [Salinivirgaceae bacterium]
MTLFDKIKNNHYVKHIGIALIGIIVLSWLVFFGLKIFTRHGKTYLVPDLTGLTVPEAQTVTNRYGFKLEVSDSTFVGGRQKGTVVSHIPKCDERVKKNRRIFVTINAFSIPKVAMPKVTGVSYRQAKVTLESSGLKVGKLIYRPDPMKNYVLGQNYNGETIKTGSMISKDEPIDLILGNGYSSETKKVTEVIGLSFLDASETLNNEYINIGATIYDSSVKTYSDSINAKIYKQHPNSGISVRLGTYVDLWLSVNPEQFNE